MAWLGLPVFVFGRGERSLWCTPRLRRRPCSTLPTPLISPAPLQTAGARLRRDTLAENLPSSFRRVSPAKQQASLYTVATDKRTAHGSREQQGEGQRGGSFTTRYQVARIQMTGKYPPHPYLGARWLFHVSCLTFEVIAVGVLTLNRSL